MQELLEGGVVPSEDSMTVVLCDEVAQVDLLYTTKMVDAKVMRRGGSTLDNDSNKVCEVRARLPAHFACWNSPCQCQESSGHHDALATFGLTHDTYSVHV